MSKVIRLIVDGQEIDALEGQSIMSACEAQGIYIPRLCDYGGLVPQGSCRVCSVKINGKVVASCTQPAEDGAIIENESSEITGYRKDLVRMLFHEGNHLCPICEASGRCELQATAYRLGLSQASDFPYLQPSRPVDASHPDIALDNNRCILCGRCVRASQDVDDKNVFEYVGRGINKRIGVNGDCLADTDADINDYAMSTEVCPVGCIIRKREGFFAPAGERKYDHHIIGSGIESRSPHKLSTRQIDAQHFDPRQVKSNTSDTNTDE